MTPRWSRRLLVLSLLLPSLGRAAGDVKVDPGAGVHPVTPSGQNDLQKLNPLPTPLTPNTGVGSTGIDVAGAVPQLPSSIVPAGQSEAGASRVEAQTPRAGEWDAEIVLKNGQAEFVPIAAHQAIEPYFVTSLSRLGVPQDLAVKLAEYQASRHPGDQTKSYHSLGHSQDVPAIVSAILENLPEGQLTDRQQILLILAAALHDIDPARKPETPARVETTLEYLQTDPASRALLAEFGRRYGITTAQVQALIKATDFNPAQQQKIQDDFENRVKTAFPASEQNWALEWGRKLSFADKSATYLGSVEASDRQVRNLANEIRKAVEAATGQPAPDREEMVLRGSEKFLKVLKDSPDFAILPEMLQRNFGTVYAHFKELADPATKIRPLDPSNRGPPFTADTTVRRLSLGQPRIARDLAALQGPGYAVLAPGALMDARSEQRVLDIVDKHWMKNGQISGTVYPLKDPTMSKESPLKPLLDEVYAELGPSIRGLTTRLNAALAGEKIKVRDVQLRLATPSSPEKQFMHVDLGGYLTATYALRGRGTVLYRVRNGRVEAREAPTHSWAVITNLEREFAGTKDKSIGNVKGTVHDIPVTDRDRVLLIIRFSAEELPAMTDEERRLMNARAKARVESYLSALADEESAQVKKPKAAPKKGGLFGAVKKLFGE